jgi:HAD superfamily hydrolase (TIGR01509 family)
MGIDLARIQAICFDVDGTLSDTDDVWAEQLARTMYPLARLMPRQDLTVLARRLILAAETPGNLAYTFLDRLGLDDEVGAIFNFLARHRAGIRPHRFRLINGVDSLLPALAERYPLAVISARDEKTTLAFLEMFGLRPLFRCVATSQTCIHTKPFPDPLFWAAEQMGVAPAACLMVGDTTVDIRMGRAAGAQTVGVLCGFGDERELSRAGADGILTETADIEHLLLSRNSSA